MSRLAALALLILVALTSMGAKRESNVDTVARALHSTVTLQDAGGRVFCSGVIVDHKVLTAYHCIQDGAPTFVRTVDGVWFADVVDYDLVEDLAVLLPADRHKLRKGVRLARKTPNFGQDVWLIGHSFGFYEYSVTRGVVSHPHREDGLFGGRWIQHDADQVGGNSGGPLLNARGRLVGIASFSIITQSICQGACINQMYRPTHVHGAVHLGSIREILN